jgi:hypothetical protein
VLDILVRPLLVAPLLVAPLALGSLGATAGLEATADRVADTFAIGRLVVAFAGALLEACFFLDAEAGLAAAVDFFVVDFLLTTDDLDDLTAALTATAFPLRFDPVEVFFDGVFATLP